MGWVMDEWIKALHNALMLHECLKVKIKLCFMHFIPTFLELFESFTYAIYNYFLLWKKNVLQSLFFKLQGLCFDLFYFL